MGAETQQRLKVAKIRAEKYRATSVLHYPKLLRLLLVTAGVLVFS